MAAAAMIPMPSTRPIMRRAPGSDAMLFSAIKLTSEQSHPEYERDENAKTRIDERWRPYIRIDTSAFKQPPSEQCRHNADRRAQHPRWKERTDGIDLWSHGSSLSPNETCSETSRDYEINSKHEI